MDDLLRHSSSNSRSFSLNLVPGGFTNNELHGKFTFLSLVLIFGMLIKNIKVSLMGFQYSEKNSITALKVISENH